MLQDFERTGEEPERDGGKIKKQTEALGARLSLLQQAVRKKGLPVILLFEGWGAAGKGGLISDLISTAMQMCRDVARADDTVLNENAAITRIAVLYTVAYLYEHREEANHQTLLLTLRALLFGVRKEAF